MEAEERELRGRELDLRRVDGGEDLVAELQLDRAPQGGQLALRRTEALQVVQRFEDRLLVQRRERAPIADRVRDEPGEDQSLPAPQLLLAHVRGHELITELMRVAVASDVTPLRH